MSTLYVEKYPATIISHNAIEYFKCPKTLGVYVYVNYIMELNQGKSITFEEMLDIVCKYFNNWYPKGDFECMLIKIMEYQKSKK